jgi:transposase
VFFYLEDMGPYSLDLRERIVDAYHRKEGSVRELADRFSVGVNTVQRYLSLQRQTGALQPRPHTGGPPRLIDAQALQTVRALLQEKNDRTDAEYAEAFGRCTGLRVSRRTMNRTWQRLGVTRKKKPSGTRAR